MALIFSASGDIKSFHHSSRIIGPVVHWLFPDLTERQVARIVYWVRKCAHVAEYALLAALAWRALRKPEANNPRPWLWKHAAIALGIVFAYAATDEWHQVFVPNRLGSFTDVMIDTLGGALGLGFIWLAGRVCKRW